MGKGESIERVAPRGAMAKGDRATVIAESLAKIAVAYRLPADKAQAQLSLSVWAEATADYSGEVVAEAVARAIKSERYPPCPAVVLEHCNTIMKERREAEHQAAQRAYFAGYNSVEEHERATKGRMRPDRLEAEAQAREREARL